MTKVLWGGTDPILWGGDPSKVVYWGGIPDAGAALDTGLHLLVYPHGGGTAIGELTRAVPGPYSHRTGFEVGEFTFSFSIWDEAAIEHLPIDETVQREVGLWDYVAATVDGEPVIVDGEPVIYPVLLWYGVPGPWQADLDDQTATVHCRTLEWFDTRRFFGWAERDNLLENGGFETWTAGPTSAPDSWAIAGSATVARQPAIARGDYSAELTATDTASYLWQQETGGVDIEYTPGLIVIATGWAQIQAGATVNKGDVLAELIVDGAPGTFTEQFVADSTTQAGELIRVVVRLLVASGVDWTGEVRCHSVNGSIRWDDVELVFNDATTVAQNGGAGDDLARLVENVTEYSQGAPWSNLGIGHDCPDTGIMVLRGWEHARHEWIADAYRQLIDDYGVDIWVDVTGGLDRVLRLRKKRGRTRPDLDVVVTVDPDDPATFRALDALASQKVTGDPSLASNVVIVTGESSTFASDEAGALDADAFGGLTLAKWDRAPVSTSPLDLDNRASTMVDREKVPPVFPTVVVPLDTNDQPEPGDVFNLAVTCGWVRLLFDVRAQTVTVDPVARTASVVVDRDDGLPLTDEE